MAKGGKVPCTPINTSLTLGTSGKSIGGSKTPITSSISFENSKIKIGK
jgi:hypothetical protein